MITHFQLKSCLAVGLAIFAAARASEFPAATGAAMTSITTNDLQRHIEVLSSDAFEGRAPGTAGEERTVGYLLREFQKLDVKPGNPNGTFIQDVPLMGFRAVEPMISFRTSTDRLEPNFPSEAVIWSRHFEPEIKVDSSEVVFVGYGVVAPEYGWDDYKGVDIRGKTILMLINDPAVPDPNESSKLDDKMFKGRTMTYYGRWTYKFEIATAKGAAAAIIVHETIPAAYPWAVVEGSNSRENFDLLTPDRNRGRVPIEGWITLEKAQKLCSMGGHKFESLKQSALRRDFRPVSLGVKADFKLKNELREIASRNVIAKIEGTDDKLKNEFVIYSAHWDHLGQDPKLPGDQIFNGAADNASGIAVLLELADAFTRARPKRSVLFLAVTAEEKGLLGAKYYAHNPLYPLDHTLANINMDNMNTWGRTRDIGIVGSGQSTLEETLRAVAAAQGRTVVPESEPEKGYYFRSDHFEFAKQGVPALYTDEGTDFVGQPKDFGRTKRQEYVARDYHKVSDEIKPGWDLSGLVDDTQLLFQVGYSISQSSRWPEWKPGSEFKSRRDAMLRERSTP